MAIVLVIFFGGSFQRKREAITSQQLAHLTASNVGAPGGRGGRGSHRAVISARRTVSAGASPASASRIARPSS